jgi:hypothetical protein
VAKVIQPDQSEQLPVFLVSKQQNRFKITFQGGNLEKPDQHWLALQTKTVNTVQRPSNLLETGNVDAIEVTFDDDVENHVLKTLYSMFIEEDMVYTISITYHDENNNKLSTWIYQTFMDRLDQGVVNYATGESATVSAVFVIDEWNIVFEK